MLLFAVLMFFVSASGSTKSASSLTSLGTKSLNRADLVASSRYKRAQTEPGWGKRAPGWGKRQSVNDDRYDDLPGISDISSTGDVFSPMTYVKDASFLGDNIEHGWGKRAPGWGKRFSEEDSNTRNMAADLDLSAPRWIKRSVNSEHGSEYAEMDKRAPGWGKRAPGWGKRAPGWGKRAPGWGKRAPGWGKRAPGWGKRAPGWGKRAPGWGKRNNEIDLESSGTETDADYEERDSEPSTDEEYLDKLDTSQERTNKNAVLKPETLLSREVLSTEKRAPGWGKRAPGWGKRDYMTEISKEDLHFGKRAPGWGKRAPGWGKRAPGWGKRTSGWVKRAPGWGKRDFEIPIEDDISAEELEEDKRAPGWGKRDSKRAKRAASYIAHPSHDGSHELFGTENEFVSRGTELAEQRFLGGGNRNVVSKTSRK